jgi:hypothetical protein
MNMGNAFRIGLLVILGCLVWAAFDYSATLKWIENRHYELCDFSHSHNNEEISEVNRLHHWNCLRRKESQ